MAWITDDELEAALKGALGIDPDAPLPPHFEKVVPWANRQAYYAVRAALIGRGFTADQVDDWEQREEFNERLGVCFAIKRAAMRGEGYDTQAAVEDCKEAVEELKTVAVVVDGEKAVPENGRVSYGSFDTSTDRFTMGEDPDGEGDFPGESDGTRL